VLVAPLLAACGGDGFRPMYAANIGGESLSDRMAQVNVTTIPGRVGQRVRNELIFQTTGGGEGQAKNYKLDIVLRERLTSQLVDIQGNAESQIYHIDADFQLTDNRTKQVVFKGQSFGRAGFQRFQTIYANVRAKQDAENRTARTIAHDIKGRIEAYLSRS
jgi:LPS-assembly lipoprotein